jgi:hypothetical protein
METILWLQTWRNPVLDQFFKAVTFFGSEYFYLLAITVLFWWWNKQNGLWLGLVLLLTLYLNGFLKEAFAVPRPPGVALIGAGGYSFPSGHAMGSMAFFLTLSLLGRKRWLWVLGGFMVFFIGTSRSYLGVHYPFDVITGWILSSVIVAILFGIRARFIDWLTSGNQVLVAISLAVTVTALFLIHPEPLSAQPATLLGGLAGLLLGCSLEWRKDRFKIPEGVWNRLRNVVLGVCLSIIIYAALRDIFPDMVLFRFVRYFILALWTSWGAPLLFYYLQRRLQGRC